MAGGAGVFYLRACGITVAATARGSLLLVMVVMASLAGGDGIGGLGVEHTPQIWRKKRKFAKKCMGFPWA